MILAEHQGNPYTLKVDAKHVYWTVSQGAVKRAPKAGLARGQAAEAVIQLPGARPLVLDAEWVYVANATTIVRANKADPLMVDTLVAGQQSIESVALDGAFVYWSDGAAGTVSRKPKDDPSASTTVVATGELAPSRVAVEGTWVYWATADAAAPAIRRALKDGSRAAEQVVALQPGATVNGLVVESTGIYWTEAASIWRAPLEPLPDGSAPLQLSAPTGTAADLVLDGDYVYFSQYIHGDVSRVPKEGGATVDLYANPDTGIWPVDQDEVAVYFGYTGGDGWVSRIAK